MNFEIEDVAIMARMAWLKQLKLHEDGLRRQGKYKFWPAIEARPAGGCGFVGGRV
jgi:hypothetical protein